jgi:hypothetical protein
MYQIYYILKWHSTCFGRSIGPSSGAQHCTYSKRHLSNTYCWLPARGYPLARRQQYLFDKYLLLYVQSWTPDDGRKDRPKHVEWHFKIKSIWYIGASSWFCNTVYLRIQLPVGNKYKQQQRSQLNLLETEITKGIMKSVTENWIMILTSLVSGYVYAETAFPKFKLLSNTQKNPILRILKPKNNDNCES